jgi:hypothetical protein
LFFEKGSPTNEIWYYEHKLPEGQKSYSKTKPIQYEEFKPLIEWWNNRTENELAWKVNSKDLKNFDLDIKNPNETIVEYESSDKLYDIYDNANSNAESLITEIVNEVFVEPNPTLENIVSQNIGLLKNQDSVKLLKTAILKEAIQGGLKESSATLFPKGTLLIAMYGATAGKLSILNRDASTNQAICGFFFNEFIETKYLFYFLMAQRAKMISDSWGMSQPNISQTYLRNFVFALPPREEQKIIIEKVELLMNKCLKLSQEIETLDKHGKTLMKAMFNETFETKTEECQD